MESALCPNSVHLTFYLGPNSAANDVVICVADAASAVQLSYHERVEIPTDVGYLVR